MSRSAWLTSLSDESSLLETSQIALLLTNNMVNYFLCPRKRQIHSSVIGGKIRLIHFSMNHSTLIIKAQCIGLRMIKSSERLGLGLLSLRLINPCVYRTARETGLAVIQLNVNQC
ncbi:hypothetical protein cypCar_00048749, partial [Cyprinus carpio]